MSKFVEKMIGKYRKAQLIDQHTEQSRVKDRLHNQQIYVTGVHLVSPHNTVKIIEWGK